MESAPAADREKNGAFELSSPAIAMIAFDCFRRKQQIQSTGAWASR